MNIRQLDPRDDSEWLRMRDALWPGLAVTQHRAEMEPYRSQPTKAVFVADRGNGRLGGFLELNERSVADGCNSSPVAYIEGWYVDADLRQTGIGGGLVQAAEQHARAAGYEEIASDCVLGNDVSLRAHKAIGFEELHRSIHFRKSLADAGSLPSE